MFKKNNKWQLIWHCCWGINKECFELKWSLHFLKRADFTHIKHLFASWVYRSNDAKLFAISRKKYIFLNVNNPDVKYIVKYIFALYVSLGAPIVSLLKIIYMKQIIIPSLTTGESTVFNKQVYNIMVRTIVKSMTHQFLIHQSKTHQHGTLYDVII